MIDNILLVILQIGCLVDWRADYILRKHFTQAYYVLTYLQCVKKNIKEWIYYLKYIEDVLLIPDLVLCFYCSLRSFSWSILYTLSQLKSLKFCTVAPNLYLILNLQNCFIYVT